MNKLLFTIIVLSFPLLTFAQRLEVGGAIGFSNYLGDIASQGRVSVDEINVGFLAYVRGQISPQIAWKGNFLASKLEGHDYKHFDDGAWRRDRNISFETYFQELSIRAEWNFLTAKNDSRIFHPYLFAGTGALYSQNRMMQNTLDAGSGSGPMERRVSFSVPFGAGFYFDGADNLTIGFEFTNGMLFNDFLDGFSAEEFSRGNDWYNFFALTVGYKLQKKNAYQRYRRQKSWN
ncbi:MAG: DUF6089 family protein [Bacteroidota bacterium]